MVRGSTYLARVAVRVETCGAVRGRGFAVLYCICMFMLCCIIIVLYLYVYVLCSVTSYILFVSLCYIALYCLNLTLAARNNPKKLEVRVVSM